jgi:hypothetical protein
MMPLQLLSMLSQSSGASGWIAAFESLQSPLSHGEEHGGWMQARTAGPLA